MRFGPVPLDDALGAILAHTHRLPGGRPLPKGTVLDPAAIARLRASGTATVIAARLDASDVSEDEAAATIARAVEAPGLRLTAAATGRVNVVATAAGLFRAAAAAVDAFNRVSEAITLATLADRAVVVAGDMVATLKIIPLGVPASEVAAAAAALRGQVLRLTPFRARRVGLVVTETPGLKDSVVAGTIAATGSRVRALTGTLLPPMRTPHDAAAIGAALRRLRDDGADMLLIAGASATVDRADEGPAGIVAAGGAITHFGMPVDPGNLICVGELDGVPALVLPGCARSPAANGIDLCLARLFADEVLGAADIQGMGVGGLMKEGARGLSRVAAAKPAPAQRHVAAMVLAAGMSRRMAPLNKLLIRGPDGRPMVATVVDAALASLARPVLVVLGHDAGSVRAALAGRDVTFVMADNFRDGLSGSLRAGLAALGPAVDAALVLLGDMPLVTAATLDALIAAHEPLEGRTIVVPTHDGAIGNPVLWDRSLFAEMARAGGDRGARFLLDAHADRVATVDRGPEVLRDFDDPAALSGW